MPLAVPDISHLERIMPWPASCRRTRTTAVLVTQLVFIVCLLLCVTAAQRLELRAGPDVLAGRRRSLPSHTTLPAVQPRVREVGPMTQMQGSRARGRSSASVRAHTHTAPRMTH